MRTNGLGHRGQGPGLDMGTGDQSTPSSLNVNHVTGRCLSGIQSLAHDTNVTGKRGLLYPLLPNIASPRSCQWFSIIVYW